MTGIMQHFRNQLAALEDVKKRQERRMTRKSSLDMMTSIMNKSFYVMEPDPIEELDKMVITPQGALHSGSASPPDLLMTTSFINRNPTHMDLDLELVKNIDVPTLPQTVTDYGIQTPKSHSRMFLNWGQGVNTAFYR
ncbi:hypothetical protein Ciccas_003097 [Cichlidogyrus casuarinus]|uniref:Uncharacterized protein n=1 Tax=Cichlidogyrus casuarinus TaxID=1844966 RepID=A0ABD2QGC4_9PLAT